MLKFTDIAEIVTNITFNYQHETWKLMLDLDQKGGNRPYIQVVANGVDQHTGNPMQWSGRKWYLLPHVPQ